jgi:hypothetical protein
LLSDFDLLQYTANKHSMTRGRDGTKSSSRAIATMDD